MGFSFFPTLNSALQYKRDDSGCPPNQYVSPVGLEFQTSCNTNLVNGDLKRENQDNATACMYSCSINRPRCYGIVFDSSSSSTNCYLKDNTTSTDGLVSQSGDVAALANATQLESPTDLSCPYTPNSYQNASNGMEFEILCGLDMDGYGDGWCPWSGGNGTCDNGNWLSHTDTLEECMDMCSQVHPLCVGVSWNPDMVAGYANCYLKNSQKGTPGPNSGFTTHSAIVRLSSTDDTCPTNKTYIANNGKNFTVSCWQDRTGTTNFTAHHDSTLDNCINRCATHSGQEDCIGVTFDNSLDGGYENCYLLNTTGSPNGGGTNTTFAQLGTSSSITTDHRHHHRPSTKAWIAAPVVIGFAVLALITGYFIWQRNRKRRNRNRALAWHDQHQLQQNPVHGTATEVVAEVPNRPPPQEKPAREEVAHLLPDRETAAPELATTRLARMGNARHEMDT